MPSFAQPDIEAAVDSDFQPLILSYEPVIQFSSQKILLRSSMTIQSAEFGKLRQEQYRYVARRTVQSEQVFRRQLHKVLCAMPELMKTHPNLQAVTIPVYNRMLKKGNLASTIFEELARHPGTSAGNLCVEVSADLLFEELEPMAAELQRVKDMGVFVAIWELGDPYCPLMRLSQVPYDYLILDSYPVSLLETGEEDSVSQFRALCQFLHGNELARIIAPGLSDSNLAQQAEQLGCDGYSLGKQAAPPAEEEGDA